MKRNSVFAMIVILVGILMFMENAGYIKINLSILIIGISFLGAYIFLGGYHRNINLFLLITSLILIGFSIFKFLETYTFFRNIKEETFLIITATEFLLSHLIHNLKQNNISFSSKHWTLFTSIVLYFSAIYIAVLKFKGYYTISFTLKYLWPIILLLIGVFMLLSNTNSKNPQ